MKKVLLLIDSLGAGGAQRQLVGLAVLLKKRGYDVKVCIYYDFDFYKSVLDDNGVLNELIPNARHRLTRISSIRTYIKQEHPDCVISYQETPSLIASLIRASGLKYNLIVSERNTTQKIGLNERLRFWLYRWANSIVPNSYAQERFLLSRYSWMGSRVKTITNFVDLKKFIPEDEHKRHSVPEILVVGSVSHSKNTKGFIKAIKALKEKGVSFHATWYGWTDSPNDYMNEAQLLVNELELNDVFEFRNKTLNIAPVYKKTDYFCIPSFYEGTPNVLCEAISCGCPVAASNVCDNARYAQEDVNGFLFDPNDIDSIVKGLEQLLALKEQEYIAFRRNSRKIAEDLLSQETFLQQYMSLIEA